MKSRIYLDFASATPIDKTVLGIMSSYNKDYFANSSSIHGSGVKTREIIEKSRELIAKGINAHNNEIIFAGSSTESIALAIRGVITNYQLLIKNLKTDAKSKIPHIITSEIEHPAVLENCKMLEERGEAEITYIKINEDGIINPRDVRDAIKDNTILVSIMYANNEIGTIQPIQEIAKEIRHYKKNSKQNIYPLFHTDATQAMNYLDTSNIEKLGVDMMSFNGSKIYGPKGIGILYKKREVELSPIYTGGGQEFGLRSGTEDVAKIAGIALALQITNKIKDKEIERLIKLRDYTIDKLLNIKVGTYKIVLNGSKEERLPNNINISISGIPSELLVIELDAKGIDVSSKSACKSEDESESYVLKALRMASGEEVKEEEGSLRITLGRQTNKEDMDRFLLTLNKILLKYCNWNK